MTSPHHKLVQRYKTNYGINAEHRVTEDMVLHHWELEQTLRQTLLDAPPDTRWQVFEEAYTTLYHELAWLNEWSHTNTHEPPAVRFAPWRDVMGTPPQHIYEVGSGRGELIHYLATCGFTCTATEITRERGKKWALNHPNLTWNISDGVHLEQFEEPGHYDVVLSNHVIEHMHPDDVLDHCKNVYRLLTPTGRYIIATPHASFGPEDVSRVFLTDTPQGMHLKEYTYRELVLLLRQAGFTRIASVVRTPAKIRRRVGVQLAAYASCVYLNHVTILEWLISFASKQSQRRTFAKLLQMALFPNSIMIVAYKTTS